MSLEDRITARQMRLGPSAAVNRTRRDYLRSAVWWRLESLRGYPSSDQSRWYAESMKRAALALQPGESMTWAELKAAGRV